MKTLEEKNRMIAKFMGFEDESRFIGGHNVMRRKTIWKFGCQQYESYNYDDLKYHISWDWLMPVVEKIESLEYSVEKNLQRIDGDFQCLITKGNDILFQEFAVKSIESGHWEHVLKAMHYLVVEFINFYNEQK